MYKILLLSILSLFAFAKSNAQEVTFGAKIGFNYATVTGDNANSYEPITSIMAGVMAEITLTEKLAFQPELIFSSQGFRSEAFDLKVHYVNFPLLAKYYFAKGISLEAGPQIGFRSIALAQTPLGDFDARDNVKTFDLGASAGLGYKLENGINFGARYNYGFSNINRYQGEKVSNQNAVFQAYVGFFFF